MRAVCIMLLLFLLAGSGSAWGQMLLEEEENSEDHTGAGVTFLLLSMVTLAYGINSFSDSQDDLDRADASYAQFQVTSTTALQEATSDALNDARVNEDRANAAVFLTLLFAITSYYSFFPEDLPDVSLAATPRGILYRYRF